MNNSSVEEIEIENNKDKNKDKDKNTLYNIIEKKESDNLENENIDNLNINDIEGNKNMRAVRRKMSQIRAKAGKNIPKETKDIINDNFKTIFDICLKKEDDKKVKVNLTPKLHGSGDENKNANIRPRTKSIFEVLSNSSKKIKKIIELYIYESTM